MILNQHVFVANPTETTPIKCRYGPKGFYTTVKVAVKQSMVCSHKILLCDMAFKFHEEKHYLPHRQPLDDFQDMSPPYIGVWSITKPSSFTLSSSFYFVAATQDADWNLSLCFIQQQLVGYAPLLCLPEITIWSAAASITAYCCGVQPSVSKSSVISKDRHFWPSPKSFTSTKNSSGPSTDPWWTPCLKPYCI